MKGVPGVVGRTMIRPPVSRLGPAKDAERNAIIANSDLKDKYTEMVDRESAYEVLEEKTLAREKAAIEAEEEEAKAAKKEAAAKKKAAKKKPTRKRSTRRKKTAGGVIAHEAKLIARQLIRREGRRILRGVLGGLMRR